jgi:hypothetical protein
MPFGSLDEVIKLYRSKEYENSLQEIKDFKADSDKIKDAKIVGTSQFGVYFRFVEKTQIDNSYPIHARNNVEFNDKRSFIFDIEKLLNYISSKQTNIPLCWFADFNAYGYQSYGPVFEKNIIVFLNLTGRLLQGKLHDHEFVCRIPIPLIPESGFIGKINYDTLDICEEPWSENSGSENSGSENSGSENSGSENFNPAAKSLKKIVLNKKNLTPKDTEQINLYQPKDTDQLYKLKNPLPFQKQMRWLCIGNYQTGNLKCYLHTDHDGKKIDIRNSNTPFPMSPDKLEKIF